METSTINSARPNAVLACQPYDTLVQEGLQSSRRFHDSEAPLEESVVTARSLELQNRDHKLNIMVPAGMFNEAAVDYFRKEFRAKRLNGHNSSVHSHDNPQHLVSMTSFDSLPIEHSASMSSCKSSSQKNQKQKQAKKGYQQELEKTKVYQLTHRGNSYGSKWHKMKEKRDLRHAREEKMHHRSDVIGILKKTVITADRMDFHHALDHNESKKRLEIEMRYNQAREREILSKQRKLTRAQEECLRKEMNAASLRDAIAFSTELSKLSLTEEKLQKRALKPLSGIQKLSETSSTLVSIPDDITDRIKNAKRLTQFNQAKQDAKNLYESTLSERISRYAAAKSLAIAKAANTGARIALAPIRGDDIFEDPPLERLTSPLQFLPSSSMTLSSSSQMLGFHSQSNPSLPNSRIAPLVYPASRSASAGMLHNNNNNNNNNDYQAQNNFSRQGTGAISSGSPSPMFATENAFLKELAMREYWSRQSEYENDNCSEASDGSKPDDSSWKTDPRLKNIRYNQPYVEDKSYRMRGSGVP